MRDIDSINNTLNVRGVFGHPGEQRDFENDLDQLNTLRQKRKRSKQNFSGLKAQIPISCKRIKKTSQRRFVEEDSAASYSKKKQRQIQIARFRHQEENGFKSPFRQPSGLQQRRPEDQLQF